MENCALAWLKPWKQVRPLAGLARVRQIFTHGLLAGLGWLLLAALPANAGQDGAFTYTVTNGSVTITAFTGVGGEWVIPSTIEGLPVTAIGDRAFWYQMRIRGLTIPEGVTSIGNFAFSYCPSLTNLVVPDSVRHIGSWAFSNCEGLPQFRVPNSLTNIGDNVFYGCASLTNLAIPNSVTSIGNYAFYYCLRLASIQVPDSVVAIGDYAFCHCPVLTDVALGGGVQSIGDSAFSECFALRQVAVPDNVTHLGAKAFTWCSSLASVQLGAGLASVGTNAFLYCGALTNIEVAAANATYGSVKGVLLDKTRSALIVYPPGRTAAAYAVPEGISLIGSNAFKFTGLAQVTLPDSVVAIEEHAFDGCPRLSTVNLGNSVASIGSYAFSNCTNLTRINLPNSLTNVGSFSFLSCQKLASLIIPSHVTYIGDGAFTSCTGLKGLYFLGSAPAIGNYILAATYISRIYYLEGKLGWSSTFALRPAEPWKLQFMKTYDQLGVRSNQFGLTVYWKPGSKVVLEACEDILKPNWHSVVTNTLADGPTEFRDPQEAQYPQRFYRLRAP